MPRHDGIRLAAVRSEQQSGAGYLLVYVERSERRPHRCEATGEGRYFKRAGDNTFPMEHYDIEDAFRRASLPDLAMKWSLAWHGGTSGPEGQTQHFILVLALMNASHVTATFPYFSVRNLMGTKVAERHFLLRRTQGSWVTFSGGADDVIHPGQDLEVGGLDVVVRRPNTVSPPSLNDVPWDEAVVAFEYQFGCRDVHAKGGILRLDALTMGLRG
jgi:hypothetical protein